MRTVDLNCDMGEGMATDAEIMPFITSANIACGYHAGDSATMELTVRCAIEHGVAIGAHPGFDDKPSFGRRAINLSPSDIYQLVTVQVQQLTLICEKQNARLAHVKPHGALYNMAADDRLIALAIAQAIFDIQPELILFGLSGSCLITAAENIGLRTASEVFADRTYDNNGRLTPRSMHNALIPDDAEAIHQVIQMITEGTVRSTCGSLVPIKAETICIHGDGPNAQRFAKRINEQLKLHRIELKSPKNK